MQEREQDLAAAQVAVLGRHRFLDLEHQIGAGPDLFGGADQLGANRLEVRVGDRRAFAGAGLDKHLVPAAGQFGDACRSDGDPEFVVLGLGGNTDAHALNCEESSMSWQRC